MDPPNNLGATEAFPAETPRGAAMKFTYTSGSRPLEGYTIKRGIGRGGFGEVYYAVSDAGKEVALKLIRRHLEVELRGVRQCLNMKHPNLLALHDIRTDGEGDRWVIMEYISGESLEDVVERNPNGLPLEEALAWFRGIAAGVAYLHDHGVVHRDLKPGNIFLDEGIVKIGDYGLSKFVSCSHRSGQTESVGTLHYMAPEIANGRYGKEIDTYALGIILYEMLTGRVPFEGESVGEVLMKHLTAQPELQQLDEPHRTIVARALAKDPDHRFRSAKEMIAPLPLAAGQAAPGGVRVPGANPAPAYEAASSAQYSQHEPIDAEIVLEEPIARWVNDRISPIRAAWARANFHPVVQVAIVLAAVIALLATSEIWFPLAFVALFLYAVYRFIRWIVLPSTHVRRHAHRAQRHAAVHAQAAAAPGEANAVAEQVAAPAAQHAKRSTSWRRAQRPPLPEKSPQQKFRELTGSMLVAAAVASTVSLVMLVLRHQAFAPQQLVWLALVGTFGAWAVMIPAKFWEGRPGDQAPRRFVMLVAGLALGVMAAGLAGFLGVELPYELGVGIQSPFYRALPAAYHATDGTPEVLAYLAHFGFLLLILRWWRLADPARPVRLGLGTTAWCVVVAYVLYFFWPFPQPWGIMLAATIAISVQLASPWQQPTTEQS